MISNIIALLTLILILFFNKSFMMIGYIMQIDIISYGLIILSI
ncbi:MAG: hypothetical protein ACEY3K_05640 [Wolbachia sp.]